MKRICTKCNGNSFGVYEPTKDEIEAATKKIKKGWLPNMEQRRIVGLQNKCIPFELPLFNNVDGINIEDLEL